MGKFVTLSQSRH